MCCARHSAILRAVRGNHTAHYEQGSIVRTRPQFELFQSLLYVRERLDGDCLPALACVWWSSPRRLYCVPRLYGIGLGDWTPDTAHTAKPRPLALFRHQFLSKPACAFPVGFLFKEPSIFVICIASTIPNVNPIISTHIKNMTVKR